MPRWIVSEQTLIPLGLVLVIVAAGIHFTSVRALAAQNEKAITEMKADDQYLRERLFDRITDLDRRLSKIEGKLDRLLKESK
jgi:hypothetical protein